MNWIISSCALFLNSWRSFKLLKQYHHYRSKPLSEMKAFSSKAEDGTNVKYVILSNEQQAIHADILHQLMFWVLFSLLYLWEYYFEIFVFWVPFYDSVKFVLLIWIGFPEAQGAQVVFKNFVSPYLKKPVEYVDNNIVPFTHTMISQTFCTSFSLVKRTIANLHHSLTDEDLSIIEEYAKDIVKIINDEKSLRINQTKIQNENQLDFASLISKFNGFPTEPSGMVSTNKNTSIPSISSSNKKYSAPPISTQGSNISLSLPQKSFSTSANDATFQNNLKLFSKDSDDGYVNIDGADIIESDSDNDEMNQSNLNKSTNSNTSQKQFESIAETMDIARKIALNMGMPQIVSPSRSYDIQQVKPPVKELSLTTSKKNSNQATNENTKQSMFSNITRRVRKSKNSSSS